MKAEILTTAPSSGEYDETHFGENFNSVLWVKFTNNNYEVWAGCFSKSFENGLCLVFTNEINSRSFIIAGGKGYLIDLDKKQLLVSLNEQPLIESALYTTNPFYFLAGTAYSIYVLDDNNIIKQINPGGWFDGIYLKEQNGSKAIGNLATADNQYKKNVDFDLDLVTFEISFHHKDSPGLLRKFFNKFKS